MANRLTNSHEERRPYEHPKPRIGASEIPALVERVREHKDNAAQELMLEYALGFVKAIANANRPSDFDELDLYQVASLGAIEAVARFFENDDPAEAFDADIERGILQSIEAVIVEVRAEEERDKEMVKDVQLLDIAIAAFKAEFKRIPVNTEIAHILEWSIEKVDIVQEVWENARKEYDEDILQYLEPELLESFFLDDNGSDEDDV